VDDEAALYCRTARIHRVNYLSGVTPEGPVAGAAKIRYLHAPAPAMLRPDGAGAAEVAFDQPQRAMTPGQSLVLYDGDRVVAGGLIEHAV
jgi:tRNA-uridine 2-sulfurtransferase